MRKNFLEIIIFLALLPIIFLSIYLIGNFTLLGFGGVALAAAGLAFFVFVLKNPFLGLCLVVLTLPFERIPTIDIGLFTLKFDQIFAGITIAAWLFNLLSGREKLHRFPIGIPIAAFLIIGLVSLVYAVDFSRAISVYIFITFMIVVGYLTDNLIDTREKLIKTVKLFFIIALIVCGFGVFQFLGDIAGLPNAVTGLKDIYTKIVLGFPRIQAFSMEPLFLANYLFIPLGLAVGLYIFRSKEIISGNRVISLIVLITLIIILGVSRGALIALGFFALFFVLFFSKKVISTKNILIFLASFFIIGASAFLFLKISNPGAIDKFLSHIQIEDFETGESVQKRLADYQIAYDYWQESPWIGIGPGNYGPKYKNYPAHDEVAGWETANNQYLEVMAEFGILGLMFFMVAVIITLARSVASYYKTQDNTLKGILVGLTAALIAVLVQYNFFSTLYIMHVWFLIGMLIAVQNLCIQNNKSGR